MSERKPYHDALAEAARHVVAAVLAPGLDRRGATLIANGDALDRSVLTRRSTDGHTRVEILALLSAGAAVRMGSRLRLQNGAGDPEAARTLLEELGEADREPLYRNEAEGFVRAHFMTIRALALQLLQAGRLDATETGLVIGVAEGETPRSRLEQYRAER